MKRRIFDRYYKQVAVELANKGGDISALLGLRP